MWDHGRAQHERERDSRRAAILELVEARTPARSPQNCVVRKPALKNKRRESAPQSA